MINNTLCSIFLSQLFGCSVHKYTHLFMCFFSSYMHIFDVVHNITNGYSGTNGYIG